MGLNMEDGALLERYARDRDEAAFAEIVGRHLNFVYAAALRQVGGDAQFAQDVAQIVFTDLARKAGALINHPVITGWLFTSTRFAAANLVRRERLRQARETQAHVMQEVLTPDNAAARWEDVRAVLDDSLAELKPADRDAVLLRFFEQRPFAAVGVALNLSEDAARMRVDRALERLRSLLARRGVTSTAAALATAFASQSTVAAPTGLLASVTSAALAGAGPSGVATGAIGVLKFMSTTKITVAATGIVALLALGTMVYEARVARTTAMTLAATTAERDRLQASVARAEKSARRADEELAAARAEADALRATAAKPAAAAVAGSATAAGPGTIGPGTGAVDYALDHPEARAAFVDHEVLRAKARFDRFFKQAHLSPEQQEQFLKNLREFAEGKLDFMGAIRTYGYNAENLPADPTTVAQMGRLEKQIPANLQASMRALLGDDGFKEYQQYSNRLPLRNVVDEVAGQLYDTDTPLTAAQAEQLVDILKQNPFRTPIQSFKGNTVAGTFIPLPVYNGAKTQLNFQGGSTLTDWQEPVADIAMTHAASVLSPPQLAALRQVQERQAARLLATPAKKPTGK
jgi:RNA polymerase sigma factor (sigma-70 family)